MNRIVQVLEGRPVIAAVRHLPDLAPALESPVGIIFLLTGTIFNMPDAVARARQAGKLTFVHLDLIQGLSRDDYGVRYLADNVAPDGIITTKNSLVASARGRGLLTVQRTFLLDSQSVASGIHLVNESKPDVLEVLPGIIPGEVQQIVRKIRVPLITGGLIRTRAQCSAAMRAGAAGVSTSCQELWTFTPMAGAVAGGKEVDLFKAHREVH